MPAPEFTTASAGDHAPVGFLSESHKNMTRTIKMLLLEMAHCSGSAPNLKAWHHEHATTCRAQWHAHQKSAGLKLAHKPVCQKCLLNLPVNPTQIKHDARLYVPSVQSPQIMCETNFSEFGKHESQGSPCCQDMVGQFAYSVAVAQHPSALHLFRSNPSRSRSPESGLSQGQIHAHCSRCICKH